MTYFWHDEPDTVEGWRNEVHRLQEKVELYADALGRKNVQINGLRGYIEHLTNQSLIGMPAADGGDIIRR